MNHVEALDMAEGGVSNNKTGRYDCAHEHLLIPVLPI
jgi:hypothetical protein